MSGAAHNSEASAVASLALAFHRSPTKFPELLRGNAPLPGSVNTLLRLAGGTSLSEIDPELASLAPEDQLRTAALFFIEQALFQRDASHYRVLGLNQNASVEQIKEHHRLLMRLFHPDRESQSDDRKEAYATRVNLAYNALRDADQRSSYDASLKPQTATPRQPVRRPAPVVRHRRVAKPESFWAVRVHPVLMRYLPQWVLGGTALVSVIVVGLVYLSNQPATVEQSPVAVLESEERAALPVAEDSPVEEADSKATNSLEGVALRLEKNMVADRKMLPEPLSAPVSEKEETVPPPARPEKAQTVRPPPDVTSAKPNRIAPVRAAAPAPVRQTTEPEAVAKVQAVKAVTVAKPESSNSSAIQVIQPALPARPAPAPVLAAPAPVIAVAQAVPVVEPPPPPAPMPDPNTLLARFLDAYERGDMQACMALLDEGLRADAGGKSDLRREYDALFKDTDLRHVKILSINWSRDGEFIRGEGRYRATLMRKGETLLRSHDGQLRVELVRRGNAALINGLYLTGGRT